MASTPKVALEDVADFFAEFDVTVVPPKQRPVREIPANVVAAAQRAYDTGERYKLSFRGNLELATAFYRDIKDAGPHIRNRDGSMGGSVTASQDGVVVAFSAGQKRGRKAGSGNGDTTDAATE
jgi:hypothetical protein